MRYHSKVIINFIVIMFLFLIKYSFSEELPKYYSNPNSILDEIKSHGADKIVDELFENYNVWNYILNKVASGDDKWFLVAKALSPGTDAGSSETLLNALGEALDNAPSKVLQLISDKWTIEKICSAPDIDDPRFHTYDLAIKEIEHRKESVMSVKDKSLIDLRNKCLKQLDVMKNELAIPFDLTKDKE